MIKKIFRNLVGHTNIKIDSNIADTKIESMICILIEVSRIDGKISESEKKVISEFIKKFKPGVDPELQFKKSLSESAKSVSLNKFVDNINNDCNRDEKKAFISVIWQAIKSDLEINPHENALYLRISELLKVKRSIANKIKHS
tara:strand:- start:1754 stop:2182 length:429 start_codon:yes stop_codon:yes gene_type:complete